MNEKDKAITVAMHEAARLELALAVPDNVLSPLVADITSRRSDEVICVINTAQDPGGVSALRESILAVVRRDVLFEALGKGVPALAERKPGHIPFVVIDRFGTTVVQIAEPVRVNAVGGSA